LIYTTPNVVVLSTRSFFFLPPLAFVDCPLLPPTAYCRSISTQNANTFYM